MIKFFMVKFPLGDLLILNLINTILFIKRNAMKLHVALVFALALSIGLSACGGGGKSSTDKRIKKQEKHRKKHPCPQLDC
jgi:hypothetical protein